MFAEAIDGGFADPVFDAQSVFKAVMGAMARPGTVVSVRPLAAAPAPLSATTAAVALTLCDHDTPLWLDSYLAASAAVYSWLGFHSGAPLVEVPGRAAFALAAAPAKLPPLDHFAQGTQEYPDRSTTLVLQIESLSSGPKLRLQGPGIQSAASLAPTSLPPDFIDQWRDNHARFPRGVDVILTAPDALACLPRTARIEKMEG